MTLESTRCLTEKSTILGNLEETQAEMKLVGFRKRKSIIVYTLLNMTVATLRKQEERKAENQKKKKSIDPAQVFSGVAIDLTTHKWRLLPRKVGVQNIALEMRLFCTGE